MPKALIVEDEPEANELLSMLVQLRGYQTESAFTGNEALEKVDQSQPDIVFLDLMLPDINGYDVCRQLRACRETSGIPVVMVTARFAAENRLQGFRLGATDYVPKPYTPDQIFSAMAKADAWKCRLAECDQEGVIPLDTRSEVAHLLEISRLWSLLLKRTSLSEEAARVLDQVLVDLSSRAIEWGIRTGNTLVATLRYKWDRDGVTITMKDESGWFIADPPRRPEGMGALIARGQFDEICQNETLHQIIMTLFFTEKV